MNAPVFIQAPTKPFDAAQRARALIFALAAADQTYDFCGPSLKRALGVERRATDRMPAVVRRELKIALRQARKLVEQLEQAEANLPE